jgi:hypothetical protein
MRNLILRKNDDLFTPIKPSDTMEIRKTIELLYKPYFFGTFGSLILILLFVVTLSITNSFSHAVSQYVLYWPEFSVLIFGFGIQMGLFFYLRGYAKVMSDPNVGSKSIVATSGVSGGAMIACCLHHVADVIPFVGLSGVAFFLGEYQRDFLILGIMSNALGITYILSLIQKHRLFIPNRLLSRIVRVPWPQLFRLAVGLAILGLAAWIYWRFV